MFWVETVDSKKEYFEPVWYYICSNMPWVVPE